MKYFLCILIGIIVGYTYCYRQKLYREEVFDRYPGLKNIYDNRIVEERMLEWFPKNKGEVTYVGFKDKEFKVRRIK